jgi:hypothetical protein
MFSYWLIGFIGGLAMVIGALLMLAGIFKTELFVFGIVICAGGSFMRYISRQTQQTINDGTQNSNVSVSLGTIPITAHKPNHSTVSGVPPLRHFNDEEAVLSNDAFKIYLIKRYDVHREPVLDKFIFKEKIYNDLNDALEDARRFYLVDRKYPNTAN